MLLNASPTADTTCMRNSFQALPCGRRVTSLHAADTARRATSRWARIPSIWIRIKAGTAIMPFWRARFRRFSISLYGTSVNFSVRVAKRLIDVVASSLGLAITLPLYPVVAAAIYLESPGSVFIRQRRAGQLLAFDEPPTGGAPRPRFREFTMLKFRSMRPDAEKHTGVVLAS